jgi:hypothetical protein
MALAQLGKQLAQQVVGDKIQNVMDSLRAPDASKTPDPLKQDKPAAAAPGESMGSIIIGQVQAMQRACKEDQELMVLCGAGLDTMRVLEIYAPTWQVLVMTGVDTEHNVTRVISPVNTVQLVCKVVSVQAGANPARVSLIVPKAK